MKGGETFLYDLPPYSDPEGDSVTVTIDAIPDKMINNFATVQPG
jgi:hypothetical protein